MSSAKGWAIECRINAEDPFRNFLPSTGRLVRFTPPQQTMWQSDTEHLLGVRVDTGVQDGGEIPMYYDSMIAKLIVHGQDRSDAIAKMRQALNGFVIRHQQQHPLSSGALGPPQICGGRFQYQLHCGALWSGAFMQKMCRTTIRSSCLPWRRLCGANRGNAPAHCRASCRLRSQRRARLHSHRARWPRPAPTPLCMWTSLTATVAWPVCAWAQTATRYAAIRA